MKFRKLITFLALLTLMSPLGYSATEAEDDSHMEWWREARFGMFIHWGLYSIQGGEWKGKYHWYTTRSLRLLRR